MGGFEFGDYESQLIASIYEAALDSTKWRNFLAEICQFFDIDDAVLVFFDEHSCKRNLRISARLQDTSLFGSFSNPQALGDLKLALTNAAIGQPIGDQTNVMPAFSPSAPAQLASEAKPREPNQLLLPLLHQEAKLAALQLACLPGSSQIPNKVIEYIHLLSPHLVRAMFIHNQLHELVEENNSLLSALKNTNLAVILLNRQLQVIFASPEAETVLAGHPALSIRRSQYLQAYLPQDQVELEARLVELLNTNARAQRLHKHNLSFPLYHPNKTHPLKLSFISIEQISGDLGSNQAFLAVLVNDPVRQREISPGYLQQAYKFTQTETQLAQLLLKGMGTSEISLARGTSAETTRWQLKQLMHKTQTHSQTELTRLLMLLTNDFSSQTENTNKDKSY